MLSFYSDDPSLNPAKVNNFCEKMLLKKTIANKKEVGVGQFKKQRAYAWLKFDLNKMTSTLGSRCGIFGRVVACDNRGPKLESSHR